MALAVLNSITRTLNDHLTEVNSRVCSRSSGKAKGSHPLRTLPTVTGSDSRSPGELNYAGFGMGRPKGVTTEELCMQQRKSVVGIVGWKGEGQDIQGEAGRWRPCRPQDFRVTVPESSPFLHIRQQKLKEQLGHNSSTSHSNNTYTTTSSKSNKCKQDMRDENNIIFQGI